MNTVLKKYCMNPFDLVLGWVSCQSHLINSHLMLEIARVNKATE